MLESDEGAYVCRAQNEGGYAEERVYLQIQRTFATTNLNLTYFEEIYFKV